MRTLPAGVVSCQVNPQPEKPLRLLISVSITWPVVCLYLFYIFRFNYFIKKRLKIFLNFSKLAPHSVTHFEFSFKHFSPLIFFISNCCTHVNRARVRYQLCGRHALRFYQRQQATMTTTTTATTTEQTRQTRPDRQKENQLANSSYTGHLKSKHNKLQAN